VLLVSLELDEVMNYLFSVERSASWKNQYTAALNEIYQEGQFLGCKVYKPNFPSIGKIPNKADILTLAEIEQLFKRENFRYDFFLFFLCALSAGLRAGEVRALRAKQIVFEKNAIIVDGFIKKSGLRTIYNKCGSPEHPKLRVVPLPDLTLNLLDEHIRQNIVAPDDYVFTYSGRPISESMAKTNFILGLINAGIAFDRKTLMERGDWKGGHIHKTKNLIPDGRRIVIRSLRYTYVTLMSRHMDKHNLLKLTGHTTGTMVDYYNRTNLEMALAAVPDAFAATSALLPHSIGEA
jgi:integrase